MQHAPLGTPDISASRIALGAWAIGGWMWGGQDEDESIRCIHAAIDAGITLIDTAPMYGMGRSEEVVGKAIADRRDQVVVATKCNMRWDLDEPKGRAFFRTDDDAISPEGAKQVYIYGGPESVRLEIERSLVRLGIDCIDLIQTHWQDESTPIADTVGELLKLRDEGKVRAIGACNASIEQLDEYRAAGAMDTDQERYSMLDREIEAVKLPWCIKHGAAVLAYSPLCNGLLTGKMGPERTFPADDLRSQRPRFSVDSRTRVAAMLDELQPIAMRHGTTLSQLAIAWTLAQPGMTHALVGARTPRQAVENAAAADVALGTEDLATIDRAIATHGPGIAGGALADSKKK